MDVSDSVLGSIREYGMLDGADTVICAFSGGADSVCLADVLLSLAPELGVKLACAHFNHRLRGAESDRDEAFAAAWCAERGLPLYLGGGDAAEYAEKHHVGVEEAARTLRYAFLEGLGDARTRIATAHQADDQAETVLMNLIRGSGLRGLGGIPPVRGRVIRPLLGVTRADVLRYLDLRGLEHVEDSSNGDAAFRRNRLRMDVMPVLRELNPAFSEACGRSARLLRQDEEFLSSLAEKAVRLEEGEAVLDVSELRELPPSLASRALRHAVSAFGVQPEEKHVSALLSLAASEHPSARICLSGLLEARRRYGQLCIGPVRSDTPLGVTILEYGSWTSIPGSEQSVFWGEKQEISKINGKFTSFFFKKGKVCGTITVRPRREGDRLRLPGRDEKSLKKWMIQEKIPAGLRASVPVFADEAGVLAVPGLGADARAAAVPEEADSVLAILERT